MKSPRVVDILYLEVADLAYWGRSCSEFLNESLYLMAVSFDMNLDASVTKVPNVSDQVVSGRQVVEKGSEAYSLNNSFEAQLGACLLQP
jgi:hypothetical protein